MDARLPPDLHVPLQGILLMLLWFATQTGLASSEPVSDPLGGGASATLEPVPAADSTRRHRLVFACRDAGTPAFSDRPCGPSAVPHVLEVGDVAAGRASSVTPPPAAAATRPRPAPAPSEPDRGPVRSERCERLRRQLDAVDDRMRSGYSAREAARLWTRWRTLREELRRTRC